MSYVGLVHGMIPLAPLTGLAPERVTMIISHLHSTGHISDEEYSKYLLSSDINFRPKLIDEEKFYKQIIKI